MKKFDLTIIGERGNLQLLECTKFPTEEQMQTYIDNFKKLGIGIGEAKKFVFENIEI